MQNKLQSFIPTKIVIRNYTRILLTITLKYKNLRNSIIKGMSDLPHKEIFIGKYKKVRINEAYDSADFS